MTTKTKRKSQAKAGSAAATDTARVANRPDTKIGKMIALLQRKEGATLDDLVTATGWQPHSVRAALTGLKKNGHTITKSKRDDVTCYSILASS